MEVKWKSVVVLSLILVVLFAFFVSFDNGEKLILKVRNGDQAEVKRLLDKGVDVNAKTRDGWTALIYASYHGDTEVLKLLLGKGADVNAKTDMGMTALLVALDRGHTEAVKLLRAAGAKGPNEPYVLIYAAKKGNQLEVMKLLGKGADVNAKDSDGNTALGYAAAKGHTEVVKLLLSKGAEINPIDLDAALTNNHDAVYQLLKLARSGQSPLSGVPTDVKPPPMPTHTTSRPSPPKPIQHSEVAIGDLYAIVVGISDYSHPKIPKLKLSDKDARDFASFLRDQARLFRNTHITLLLNQQATKKEVEKHLFYELRKAGKDDTVIVFLSGHGADDPNTPGEFFFLTYDADPDILAATAVHMNRQWFLKKLDSKRIVLIADACHAGGFSGEGVKSLPPSFHNFMAQFRESEGRVLITSSRADEVSRERASLGNGIFTYYLIEGLRGGAADSDGIVTINSLYDYVYKKTKDSSGGQQHPQMEGRIVGKFPISIVNGTK